MSKRKCGRCGKDPAEGFASIWSAKTGEIYYCHGDDDISPTCYERAQYQEHDSLVDYMTRLFRAAKELGFSEHKS